MSTDKTHTDNNLSLRLTTARNFKRLDQKVAAKKIGISPITLNRYEKNRREAPLVTVNLLAELYGVRAAWLLTGDGLMVNNLPEKSQDNSGWMPSKIKDSDRSPKADGPVPSVGSLLDNQEDNKDIFEMTRKVIDSQTVYRGALLSNIKAFYKAVQGEQEMDDFKRMYLQDRAEWSRRFEELLSKIDQRGDSQKRDRQANE